MMDLDRPEAVRKWQEAGPPPGEVILQIERGIAEGCPPAGARAVGLPFVVVTMTHDEALELESEAVVWQNTGEVWGDVELACSTARPTLGTSPPTLTADRLSLRAKSDSERRVVDVTVREVSRVVRYVTG